jgi:DNA-binding beta-propeller fold protein YncE
MRAILFLSLFIFSGTTKAAELLPLKLIQTIAIPDVKGRIDHFAVDLKSERLFVAALGNNTVEIVDMHSGKCIQTIVGLHEPQGIMFVPQFNKIYVASGGSGNCDIFDGNSFKLTGSVKFSDDADNIRYDPEMKLIYVGFGQAVGIINSSTDKLVGDIKLAAHPESFQLEKMGHKIFVNIPSANQIAVLDREKRNVFAIWPLENASGNFPMALDEKNHRLFIGCRNPGKLLVIDSMTGKKIDEIISSGDADDICYDNATGRIYMSCGEGFIDVFKASDENHYARIAKITTAPGARTSIFIPEIRRFYLAVPYNNREIAKILVYETAP